MIAIVTGDLVNSGSYSSAVWLPSLKEVLAKKGEQPEVWDIYRGDEFQFKTTVAKALEDAILIKSVIKSIRNLDVRLAVGIGEESYSGGRITEANGTAYQQSGRLLEELKSEKQTLAIRSGMQENDEVCNLLIRMALSFMDEWSTASAETVAWTLRNPGASQQEMAESFGIQQSAVSQRQKRAHTDLVIDLLAFYRKTFKEVII
ncbi:MAG: hypothetical protein HKP08_02830 [Flavobacteriaceae bacterium]|nr:hypothetical protein [Flavobacteriaceae bacterium]